MRAPLLDRTRWNTLWQALGANPPGAGFELLTCLYAEPHRRYHTAKHIVACLTNFDMFKSLATDPAAVELSIWLHDAAYDPLRNDNEERSAEVAEMMLAQAGLRSRVDQVRQLIMATQHTCCAQPDDAGLLVDIDLSVLALPWPEYVRYTRAVRREYAAIPDERFVEGRIGVLKHFLAKSKVFVHCQIQELWEHRARENMESEITELIEHGFT
ncbi:HD domain-containing protein [Pseudomonas sp. NPDC089569]|uniref:HD domain-containing protein n=1 Tax=Pseudomonas sp. NPDC089569 TaxID=3390722 RepID=UPI003CFDB51D